MTGRPQDPAEDRWLPRPPAGPAPSAVEDLLRGTLETRADDVDWDPSLVGAALAGPAVLRVRRVPRSVAWLSAAAAAVLVVGGVSVAAGGGGGPALVDPGSGPTFTPAVAPTEVLKERFASCEQAWTRGAMAFVTPSLPPFRSFDPGAVPPATTSYEPGAGTAPPPGEGASSAGASSAEVSSVEPRTLTDSLTAPPAPSSSAPAADLPEPQAEVTTIVPGSGPTAGSQRYARTPAEEAAWNVLAVVLDEARFAGFSVGPGADEVTVHVVRGPTAAQAQALVDSCALDGVRVRPALVDWSQAQLMASALAAMDVIGGAASTGGVDVDANRGLVTIDGSLTPQLRLTLAERFGSSIEVYSYSTGEMWRPASP